MAKKKSRQITKEDELHAKKWIDQICETNVKHEPRGSSTFPDFVVGHHGFEVTWIGMSEERSQHISFYNNFNKYFHATRAPGEQFSYYLEIDFSGSFPSQKEMERIAEHFQGEFVPGRPVYLRDNTIVARAVPTQRGGNKRFLLGTISTPDSTGFVYDKLQRAICDAAHKKYEKMLNAKRVDPDFFATISTWSLLLIDSITFGGAERYREELENTVPFDHFDSIVLINPADHNTYTTLSRP